MKYKKSTIFAGFNFYSLFKKKNVVKFLVDCQNFKGKDKKYMFNLIKIKSDIKTRIINLQKTMKK